MSPKHERRATLAKPKPAGWGAGKLRLGKRSAPEHVPRAIGGGAA